MASMAAARSALRSTARGSRVAAGANPPSPLIRSLERTQNCLSRRPTSFRSPMATSRSLGSMLPYHTATASSLLNSMLSVSNRCYIWSHEELVAINIGDAKDCTGEFFPSK